MNQHLLVNHYLKLKAKGMKSIAGLLTVEVFSKSMQKKLVWTVNIQK